MKKRTFSIRYRIIFGFSLLILIFIVNGAINYWVLRNSNTALRNNTQLLNPSVAALNELLLLVTRSEMLATNWVYLPRGGSDADKNRLRKIHQQEYPQLKEKLVRLSSQWIPKERTQLEELLKSVEILLKAQQGIMMQLISFENYEDPEKKFTAEGSIESEIIPQSDVLIQKLELIAAGKNQETTISSESIMSSFDTLRNLELLLFGVVLLTGILISYRTSRSLIRPINALRSTIQQLGLGELAEKVDTKIINDEIGEMTVAVQSLAEGLRATSGFADNIGNGNYKADFQPLSEKDVLGNALLGMRSNLQRVAEEDRRRAWATGGIAKFSEILRNFTDNITELCTELITELVKYTHSNQGAIFMIEAPDREDPYLSMRACYAWDKKKYMSLRIEQGDGLVGQAWQERDTLFITDVPEDFITITSGLGEASPTNILIVPLIFNEKVQGVLEIASFEIYEPFEVDFIRQIAETIASTLSTVKTNETTKRLLEQSQQMTEEMQAQEEEMRQNMEELEATQEEMRRNEQIYIDEIEDLRQRLGVGAP
jgi:GAF domain-containing protein/HAMP domain-containing protein